MRENSHYRHCGVDGRCVSETNDCVCRCWHCIRVKANRQRMLNEAEWTIHRFHRLPEERERCPHCSRVDEERAEYLKQLRADKGQVRVA